MDKQEIVKRLLVLRRQMDTEPGGPDEWYLCLFDVCQALALSDGETAAVVGGRVWELGVLPLFQLIEDADGSRPRGLSNE